MSQNCQLLTFFQKSFFCTKKFIQDGGAGGSNSWQDVHVWVTNAFKYHPSTLDKKPSDRNANSFYWMSNTVNNRRQLKSFLLSFSSVDLFCRDYMVGYPIHLHQSRPATHSWSSWYRCKIELKQLHTSMHKVSHKLINHPQPTKRWAKEKRRFLILLMLVECLKENYTIKRLGSGYTERVPGYTANLSLMPHAVDTSIMHWPSVHLRNRICVTNALFKCNDVNSSTFLLA